MGLTPERLKAFKEIYASRFGKPLDGADEKARQFLRLMEIIYQPMRHDELATVKRRNQWLGIPATTCAPRSNDSG